MPKLINPDGHVPKGIPMSAERLARHGLSLPRTMLRALDDEGIYCFPGISVEHQHLARRFVLKGTESGGAVHSMGRYCGYLDKNGRPVPWLQPLDSFGGNGRHAIIIAEELVRIEMLRVERTCELLITHHTLSLPETGGRPVLGSTILFRARAGTIADEPSKGPGQRSGGELELVFHTSSGEILQHPAQFAEAIQKIAQAVCCIRCKHTHIAVPPPAPVKEATVS